MRALKNEALAFLETAVPFSLIVLVIQRFQIESRGFRDVTILALAGFVVHYWLPLRLRLSFFLLLSLGATGMILGWPALWLVGIGLLLAGLCHLPVAFGTRVALVLAAGATLAAMRAGLVPCPFPTFVWPVLASMFMFRLIVYLYDLRHEREPASPVRTLAYFFMLPNVCFPLFPIVDYRTFRRTYYEGDRREIHAVGLSSMMRGITHLVLYRIVYHDLTIDRADVTGPGDLAQLMVTGFLLYLRISGQFHLIVGLLRLFGFALPKTHDRYLLAAGFADLWKRMNIYWKDFVLKVVFYPVFFRVKDRLSPRLAFAVSTAAVFLASWLLHAYQWFWIRGAFQFSLPDFLFWLVMGTFVVVGSGGEQKAGRAPSLLSLALRTAGTFATTCVLWSMWTSPSLGEWQDLLAAAGGWPAALVALGLLLPVLVALAAAGKAAERFRARDLPLPGFSRAARPALLGAGAIALVVSTNPTVGSVLGPRFASFVNDARDGRLNRSEAQLLQANYYENLNNLILFNGPLADLYARRSGPPLNIFETPAWKYSRDFLGGDFVADRQTPFAGALVRVNRWGIRDRDYEREKAEGAYRVVVLGSSIELGWGVENEQTFEALVEAEINRTAAGRPYRRYELLNFSRPGASPILFPTVLTRALAFDPDAVFVFAHRGDDFLSVAHLAAVARDKRPLAPPYLESLIKSAGRQRGVPGYLTRRLMPYRREMLAWAHREVVAACRERGLLPVWVLVPELQAHGLDDDAKDAEALARSAGFVTLDLSDAYDGAEWSDLWMAEWDRHPNFRGHERLAARLYELLQEDPRTAVHFGRLEARSAAK